MWTYFCAAVAAPPPSVSTEADARYAIDSSRPALALGWLRERMAAEPSEGKWPLLYLHALAREPAQRHRALPAAAAAWGASNPDWAGVVEAYAWGVAAMPSEQYALSPFSSDGEWCEPAWSALARLPEAGAARYRTLKARLDVARVCHFDAERDEALYRDESLAGVLGPYPAAVAGLEDGVDPADGEQVKAAVAAEPFRLRDLAKYAAPDAAGPAAAEVRGWMIEQARAQAALGTPPALWTAARVFSAADLPDDERAAREQLRVADPDNFVNQRELERSNREQPAEGEVDPATILDPGERLAGLLATEPPRDRRGYQWVEWWSAVVDASEQLGDTDTFLWAAAHLARVEGPFALRLAAASVAADRHLGRAERRLDRWLDQVADPPDALAGFDGEELRRSSGAEWAAALDARAAVRAARGDAEGAIVDLEQAVVLDGFTQERRVRLATLARPDAPARAQALAAAVASAPDDARTPAMRAALDEALRTSGVWLPPTGRPRSSPRRVRRVRRARRATRRSTARRSTTSRSRSTGPPPGCSTCPGRW
ncbi:MAG: hypothetical protein ABMA64_35630 [Myxococcota bacterium]